MEKQKPPVRIISLGRVYRPDDADATHYPMFHQIEGLLIDKHVTMADLKSVLRLFAASFLGGDVHIRFRPSFFPFTEPSVEVDMAWETVGGKTRYIEMGGAGMVDPNVLRAVGYDPEEVTGFAFGLGVERRLRPAARRGRYPRVLSQRRAIFASILTLRQTGRAVRVAFWQHRMCVPRISWSAQQHAFRSQFPP